MGDGVDTLESVINGKHPFSKVLSAAKRPIIITGSAALQRPDSGALLAKIQRFCLDLKSKGTAEPNWSILNVLHRFASQVAALDLGYSPGAQRIRDAKPKILYNLGGDEGVISRKDLHKDCVVIYQGMFCL